jgi:hypothetical protein
MSFMGVSAASISTITGVTGGNSGATASFTADLAGGDVIPQTIAGEIATALQSLGAEPTAATVAAAVTSWNAVLAKMTGDQLFGLMITPVGRAAIVFMRAAQQAATGTYQSF